MTRPADLTAALRAHARGLFCLEAAAELLIGHHSWLQRSDFTTGLITTGRAPTGDTEMAVVDWHATITALEAGHLPCSGGQERMLRIAASLAAGIPIDLRDVLTGLDAHNARLVLQAVRHATGQ